MALTDFELDLVTFLDQQWQITGQLLTAELAESDWNIPKTQFLAAFNNTAFKEALMERGIMLRSLQAKDDWTAKSLTPLQLLAANTLFDLTDTRSQKKKLSDIGVSTKQYDAWLKDPVFADYLKQRADRLIGDNRHEVDLALLDRIRAGDLKAIEYYNEMSGRFVRQRAGVNSQGSVDVVNLVTSIIEIIDEEVSNPEELKRIAARLKSMITARNVAGALLGTDDEPITMPEIAPTRAELVMNEPLTNTPIKPESVKTEREPVL